MAISTKMILAFCSMWCFMLPFAWANWDEATGHLRDYKPSNVWLSRNHRHPLQLMNSPLQPYGICCAYNVVPSPRDFVADFTNANSFFWHNIGGMPGLGTNPIRDPQTGQPGYESSDGVFHVGPPNYKLRQNGHDSHYPGFRLPPAWPQIKYPAWMSNQPAHPKCGVPNGPNLDPGQQKGGVYQPAPAAAYSPPQSPTLPF